MNKKVLIIGSPLSGRNFLVGVEDDVQNFHRYVTSSIGGVYDNQNEITYLQHPSAITLSTVLKSLEYADILTIYFSGHGFRKNNEDYIFLNDNNEVFPVKLLLVNTKRLLVFIDACRTPIDTRGYGDVISGLGYHFPTDNSELAKKLYCSYINQSPLGGVIVFAASENQPSIDTESGGVYTKSLMTALHNWTYTQNEKLITVQQAFQKSVIITKSYEPTQSPKLYFHKNKEAFRIPLGVNPKAHLKATKSLSFTKSDESFFIAMSKQEMR